MCSFCRGSRGAAIWLAVLAVPLVAQAQEEPAVKERQPLVLHARAREAAAKIAGAPAGSFIVQEKTLRWDPAQTAIIICDMWNQHWCQGATRRVGELAPAMNRAVAAARAKGVLIIHAPSSCMDAYKDHPARKRAQSRPEGRQPARATSRAGATRSRPRRRGSTRSTSPTAAATTGPSARRDRPGSRRSPPSRSATRTPSATRASRSGTCSRAAGITNVMLMGVHTNMCVLGRPFGLRQLARHGKNVVLVRDLTDTMYNSRSWPYVSHFEGTNRIVEHIEKYVAPTITSTDLTGQPRVPVPARQSSPRRLLDRRGRVQDREDPAGLRQQGARAAGRPLHVRDRRPEDAARFPGGRGARRRRPAGPERPPPCAGGRPDGDHSQVHRGGQAARRHPHGVPRLRHPRQGPARGTPSGRRSIPTCSAAITPATMPTTSCPMITLAPGGKTHRDRSGCRDAVREPGLALQDAARWRPARRLCWWERSPGSRPSRSPGSTCSGHVAGLLHVAGPSR